MEVARAETAVRLAQLADVTVGTPADGDVLTYDTGAGEWQAAAPTGGGGGGDGLPTTGGTMTGTIAADGAAVDSGGALAVHGTGRDGGRRPALRGRQRRRSPRRTSP